MSYGVDNFMTIGLFYLMLSPLPDRYSLDWQLRKSRPKNPPLLGFWRRVFQLHLCVIYFFSGLTKCLGSGWWDGSNVWRALIRPPFNIIDPEILVRWKYLFPVAGIFICLLEIGYPFFIWSGKTRKIWLICICAMHFGIGVAMGMYLFAFVMIVLNRGGIRSRTHSLGAPQNQSAAPGSCLRENSSQVRFCFATVYLPSTKLAVLLGSQTGERARHAGGTDARSPARDCAPVVNRCGRLFKIARKRAD